MKKGWKTIRLNDACFIDYGTRVVKKRDGGSLYPVYGGGGVSFMIDIYNRKNCLVVSRFGMSEKCTRFVDGEFFLNDSGLTVRTRDELLSQDFLNWMLVYKNDEIYSFGKGSAQKNLDMDDFRRMVISYPTSISEQQRIVSFLGREFDKIDALKSCVEHTFRKTKDLLRAAITKELEHKEGWYKIKLGDLASFKNGLNFGKEIGSYKYYFLGVGDFKDNEVLDAKNLSFIKKDKIDEEYYLRDNDIVFVRSNGSNRLVGRCLRVFNVNDDTVYSGFCIRCRLTDTRALPQYIVSYCSTEKVRKILTSSGEGCNISNVNQKVLSSLVIDIPPTIQEQRAIISNIEDMKNKCKVLQDNYTKTIALCDDLKQSLLRKAFNGEL